MGRLKRLLLPNIYHHITQRGNRRQQTFFNPTDYESYINLLRQNCIDFEVDMISFCLMPNHVHLILKSRLGSSIRDAVANTHESYTKRINFKNGWRGHLWQGRFFSCPLSPSHLAAALNYIALNPVRGGICARPEDYLWNSVHPSQIQHFSTILSVAPGNSFKIEEIENFRKASKTGQPFGDKNYFQQLEKDLEIKILRGKSGRPKKK